MKKKVIQVPVIVGKGSAQFFIEKDVTIAPPSPPIFKIEEIKKKVFILDAHVIPGKVIFNAKLWKNVVYKTVEDVCDGIVNGPLYHSTFETFFGGFVEIDPIGCEKVKEGDIAELLEAYVEGEKDFLHDEAKCKGVTVYNKLLEKDVIKVAFKVVRYEHLPICVEEEKKEEEKKCDDSCGKKECKKEYDDKYDDKKDDHKKKEEDWEKRYDVRGDYYAKCRGKW